MNASKRKLALIDIYETAEFIARDNVEAAIRFIAAVEMSIARITEVPKIGALQIYHADPILECGM